MTSLYPDLFHCKNFAVQSDCSLQVFVYIGQRMECDKFACACMPSLAELKVSQQDECLERELTVCFRGHPRGS